MSSVQFIAIKVEAGEPLGIRLEHHKISYAVSRRIVTTPCCIVTEITTSHSEIQIGDIIISSNNRPLINNKINKTQLEDVLYILSGQLFVSRSVIFLRSLATSNNASSNQITHVTLSSEDCEMIYDRSPPSKLTTPTITIESPSYPQQQQQDDEEFEISRRVEMQVSRLQKDKENRKRIAEQDRLRILEVEKAEKTRVIEMEVSKRMEEERKKIAMEMQQAKAEAQQLEAELKRTAQEILRKQQEEQERKTQQLVTEEIKKRVAEQAEIEKKEIERQKQMAAMDRKAEEDARILQMETEVQRRAFAEALRISNERALAAEKQRADLAEHALRMTEQTKRVEEQTLALRLKQQQQEDEIERHRVELLTRRKMMEEEAQRERQRIEEEERARRVALSVQLRVDAEAIRIKNALQEDQIRKKEEETKKIALELENTKRIEKQVTLRLQEESVKIADRMRQLPALPSPPTVAFTPRSSSSSSPSSSSATTATATVAATTAVTTSATSDKDSDTRYRSPYSSSIVSPSSSSSAAAIGTTPSYTTSVNYLSTNWTSPQRVTISNNPYGSTDSQTTTTTSPYESSPRQMTTNKSPYGTIDSQFSNSVQPYGASTDNGYGSSDLHAAFDKSEFKMFEIGGIPPGPLGLALTTHKVKLTTFLMSNVSTTVTIHVVIVKQSKNTSAIQPGDVIMSVNNFTLLADERQSPGGQAHVNACAQVMANAAHPRSIRVYRSKNINMDDSVSVLTVNEAMQITPVIFSSGLDGSRQLLGALRNDYNGSNHVQVSQSTADIVQDFERRIQQSQSSPSPSSSSLVRSPKVPLNVPSFDSNNNVHDNNNNNAMTPVIQNETTDAVITQIVYNGQGAMGVTFSHHIISYQVGTYTQLVNVAVVQANTGGSTIRPGDVILSINNKPVVATPEQLIMANQTGRTFLDALSANNEAATIPKTLRFFRSSKIDLNHVLENWYRSNPIPTTTFLNELEASVFLESSVQ